MSRAEQLREVFAECGIGAALEVVGERWSFLILRGAFNGLRHFEEFQSTLGIARNILSNRLGRLVEHGILRRDPDPADRRKVTYRLTDKGRDLLPVLISLRQWGERWISRPCRATRCWSTATRRQPIAPMIVQSADGRPLSLRDMEWVDRTSSTGVDAA